jgi:hypothetical protein
MVFHRFSSKLTWWKLDMLFISDSFRGLSHSPHGRKVAGMMLPHYRWVDALIHSPLFVTITVRQ